MHAARRTVQAAALLATLGVSACSSDTGSGSGKTGLNPAGFAEPFSSTVYVEPDLLADDSPSLYDSLTPRGRGARDVIDLRIPGSTTIDAFLFDAGYTDGATIEIVVNPEFGNLTAARSEAQFYAQTIGQLPNVLRRAVARVWVHAGEMPWGGANDALIIHTGSLDAYRIAGIVEETLLHETVHLAIDPIYGVDPAWRAARNADDGFISSYAREFPDREDFAETFPMWLIARQLPDVGRAETLERIEQAIPHRLDWFDQRGFDLSPLAP